MTRLCCRHLCRFLFTICKILHHGRISLKFCKSFSAEALGFEVGIFGPATNCTPSRPVFVEDVWSFSVIAYPCIAISFIFSVYSWQNPTVLYDMLQIWPFLLHQNQDSILVYLVRLPLELHAILLLLCLDCFHSVELLWFPSVTRFLCCFFFSAKVMRFEVGIFCLVTS